jgi:hypothetical protein
MQIIQENVDKSSAQAFFVLDNGGRQQDQIDLS